MKILLGLSAAVLLAASPTTVGAWFYGTGYTAAAMTHYYRPYRYNRPYVGYRPFVGYRTARLYRYRDFY